MPRKHWRDNYDFISWQQSDCIGTQTDSAKSFLGFGFYTTTNKAQAISFADKVTKRRKNGQREVSIYEINENIAFSECLSCVLMSREKHGWILYQITDPAIMRGKPMILSLGQLPMMMFTARLPSMPLEC